MLRQTGGTRNAGIPQRPTTHAIAESAVKLVVQGVAALIAHAQAPAVFWHHAATVFAINYNSDLLGFEPQLNHADRHVFGEIGYTKLPAHTFTPDPTQGALSKCVFLDYDLQSSHGLRVQFLDKGRLRLTTILDAEWRKLEGPIRFGYRAVDSVHPLQSVVKSVLNDVVLQGPAVLARPVRGGLQAAMAECGDEDGEDGVSPEELMTNALACYVADCDAISGEDVDESDSKVPRGVFVDLGEAEDVAQPVNDHDQDQMTLKTVQPETMNVCLTRVVTLPETKKGEYAHLDWVAAEEKEKMTLTEVMKAIDLKCPVEYRAGMRVARLFAIRGVKHAEQPQSKWVAKVRVVVDGRRLQKPDEATMSSAGVDITQLFLSCVLAKGHLVRSLDATGAYAQATKSLGSLYLRVPPG